MFSCRSKVYQFFSEYFNPVNNVRALFQSPSQHISSLDVFRAFAMLWIVCKHSTQVYFNSVHPTNVLQEVVANPFFKPILAAEFGVDIFFVLSGFLIGTIIFKGLQNTGSLNILLFYIRRILRMVPIYYFVLITIVCLRYFEILPRLWGKANAIPNFLYLNNFWTVDGYFMRWTWSLAIEEQFYFIFPLIIYGAIRLKFSIPKVLVFCIVVCMYCHYRILVDYNWETYWLPFPKQNLETYKQYFDLIYVKPYIRFSSLFIGALAAYFKVSRKTDGWLDTRLKTILFGIFSILCIGAVYLGQPYDHKSSVWFQTIYRELFSVGFVSLVILSVKYKSKTPSLTGKIFYPIFQLSYGIYLIHVFVQFHIYQNFRISDFVDITNIPHAFIASVLVGVISFLISAVIIVPIYIFVERPFMNLREKKFPSA